MSRKVRKTTEEFIAQVKSINPLIEVLGEYNGCHLKTEVRCLVCNHTWLSQPTNLLSGHGCPECARVHSGDYHKRNRDSFAKELNKKNPNIMVIGNYINARTPIMVKCLKCGYEWRANPDILLNRYSVCVNCKKAGTSQVEQFLLEAFKQIIGEQKVVSRDKTAIGMELDIYIPSIKTAIEYGGWYWHKENLSRDVEKKKRCLEKQIRLINIYDGVDECLEDIPFDDFFYSFSHPLSLSRLCELEELVKRILSVIGIDDCKKLNWREIRERAIRNIDINKNSEFRSNLNQINPSIIVLDAYGGHYTNLRCKCTICGYEWEASPSNLLGSSGKAPTGCPLCAKRKLKKQFLKTSEQYIKELSEKNPLIITLGDYSGAKEKILVRCLTCGYEWKTPAEKLLHGRGCPKCRKVYKRSEEDFIKELNMISPNILLKSAYINTETLVKVQCDICKHEWAVLPASLLGKKGRNPSKCPNCRKELEKQKRRKSNSAFIEELKQKNPTISPLAEYHTMHEKVEVQCLICGHKWNATPAHLLYGQGCPKKRKHNKT